MSGRDWQDFDAELRARTPEIAAELLGNPTFRAGQEWRWGRKGSLSVVIGGAKAGMWFDHESGDGGGLVDLVAREKGFSRADALDWTADRIGMARTFGASERRHCPTRPRPTPPILPSAPVSLQARHDEVEAPDPSLDDADPAVARTKEAAVRAARIWAAAGPAPGDHPYVVRKQVAPLGVRCDARGHLVVPLQDAGGCLHSLETIAPDGAKRFLAGGAKRGHFCVIGMDPGPMPDPSGPVLICEGWATGASLTMATGHTVIAAMDAGNLLPVAEALRARFPDADLILVADNDAKPDRDTNPGVEAARKAALAVEAHIAIPTSPGDANDLFCAEGPEAVVALVASAAKIPPPPPAYPAPVLTPDEARASLADAIARFMAAIPD
jgi:putative DNA primase/helicase